MYRERSHVPAPIRPARLQTAPGALGLAGIKSCNVATSARAAQVRNYRWTTSSPHENNLFGSPCLKKEASRYGEPCNRVEI